MDAKTWVIIGLIIFMVYWYNNPADGKDLLDKGVDGTMKIKDQIMGNTDVCPTQYDPVCGFDGKDYSNSCEAQKAGVQNMTLGVC